MNTNSEKPLLFQIGFNKCATTALYELFKRSGYMALHGGGRIWRRKGIQAVIDHSPQPVIAQNIREGRPGIETLDMFEAFFDMEAIKEDPPVANYRHYKELHEAYPNAKFLLNTRNVDDWIKSRLRHGDGSYLEEAMERNGLDKDGVVDMWRKDFAQHHAEVIAYFADKPGKLIVFDIDHTPVDELIEFVRPDFELKKEKWSHVRVTDEVVERRGWQDKYV